MSRLPNLDRLKIKSGDFKLDTSKPTVLEFWAPWCPPCRGMVPHMNDLYGKYKNKANFLGVCTDSSDMSAVDGFISRLSPAYPIATDESNTVARPVMESLGVGGIPHAVVYAADGSLMWHGHPATIDDTLAKL